VPNSTIRFPNAELEGASRGDLNLTPGERLALLRRLDARHRLTTADERRLCLPSGKLIRDYDIRVVRAMRGWGPLRLR
jgi:hypothetical protein